MSFKVACLLLLGSASYVRGDPPERIIGGIQSTDHEFSYTVSVQLNGKHTCGGAIISNQHILTTAHCIIGIGTDSMESVTVVSGTNYLSQNQNAQNHSVAAMHYPTDYKNRPPPTGINWFRDIGVIKLKEPMEFNEHQVKIDLPDSSPPMNVYAVMSGWGATKASGRQNQSPPSDRLMKLNRLMIPTDVCQSYFPFIRTPISNLVICTYKQRDIGMCWGDNGSPLVYNNRLVGIASGGILCARGYPDIFTNVYEYLPLINGWLEA